MLQQLIPVRAHVLDEVGFLPFLFFQYHLVLSSSLRFLRYRRPIRHAWEPYACSFAFCFYLNLLFPKAGAVVPRLP